MFVSIVIWLISFFVSPLIMVYPMYAGYSVFIDMIIAIRIVSTIKYAVFFSWLFIIL